MSLQRDERGAILVAGVFVSAFLVGALYMLIGASTAMQHGERMQDAADSAAFSTAQMHAKGMNLIVLNNMVKVGALATIVAHGAIAQGANDTISWISRSWWRRRVYGWLRPFLAIIGLKAANKYASSVGKITRVIEAADRSQRVFQNRLPLIAEQVVNNEFQSTFYQPVEGFFVSPLPQMPLDFEPPDQMCDRMRPYAESINKRAFKSIPVSRVRNKAMKFTRGHFEDLCRMHRKPAMKLTNGADVVPGGEAFQVRAYAVGEELSTAGEKGVQVATWGAGSTNDVTKARDEVSRLAFAQGEYYFSGPTSKLLAVWSMNWRARLRRFEWKGGSLGADCGRRGGPAAACAAMPGHMNRMKWATIH